MKFLYLASYNIKNLWLKASSKIISVTMFNRNCIES